MTTILLPRPRGQPLEFPSTQLEVILARLTASGQAYVEFGGVAYWRFSGFGLLLVYTEHFPNRRLLEQFTLTYDATNFEGLSFQRDACGDDLAAALACIGWQVPSPLSLASVYMAKFLSGAQKYVQEGQLCLSGGAWAAQPAVLRSLVGQSGVQVAQQGEVIRLSVGSLELGQLPASVIRSVPVTLGASTSATLTAIPGFDVWRVPAEDRVLLDFADPASFAVDGAEVLHLSGAGATIQDLRAVSSATLGQSHGLSATQDSAGLLYNAYPGAAGLPVVRQTGGKWSGRHLLSAATGDFEWLTESGDVALLQPSHAAAMTLRRAGGLEVVGPVIAAGRNILNELDSKSPGSAPSFTSPVTVNQPSTAFGAEARLELASSSASGTSKLALSAGGKSATLELASDGSGVSVTSSDGAFNIDADTAIDGDLLVSGRNVLQELDARAPKADPDFAGILSAETAIFSGDVSVTRVDAATAQLQVVNASSAGSSRLRLSTVSGGYGRVEMGASGLAVSTETAQPVRLRVANSTVLTLGTGASLPATFAGDVTIAGNLTVQGSASSGGPAAAYTKSEADALLAAKAPLQSPAFTGTPTAPTAAAGTDSAQVASTAFVQTAVANLVGSAPATLDTLNELATALGNDPSFATTVSTQIGLKASSADVATALALKADQATTYTKTEVDTALATKASQASTYTKTQVDAQLAAKVDAGDARLSDARTPAANSVVNASVADGALSQAKVAGLTTDLAARVLGTDARLSDARTPAANSVVNASVADGALSQAKVTGLTSALQSLAPLTSPTFSGTVTASGAIAGGSFGIPSLWSLYAYPPEGTPSSVDMGTGSVAGAQLPLNLWCPVQARVSLTVLGQSVVLNDDSRLTDARTPAANSVVNASVADDALSQAKISGLTAALAAKAGLDNPTFNQSVVAANADYSQLVLRRTGDWDASLLAWSGALQVSTTQSKPIEFKIDRGASGTMSSLSLAANGTATFGGTVAAPSLTVSGAVNIPDNSLTISDTSGLQAALDGKQNVGAAGLTLGGISAPVSIKPTIDMQVDGQTQWRLASDTSGTYQLRLQRWAGIGTSFSDSITVSRSTGSITTLQDVAVGGNLSCTRITASQQPSAFLRYTGTVSVVAGSSPAKIAPNDLVYNQGGLWNATNTRFECPVAGLYSVSAGLRLSNTSTANTVLLSLRRNGGSPAMAFTTTVFMANLSFVFQLAAGDYVEVFASSPSAGATTTVITSSESFVSMTLLS